MPTILIIDDSEFDRNLLKNILVSAGYEVVGTAKGGDEGLSMYYELKPDLVMLDLIMPDINGIDLLIKIKEGSPEARVILCTSVGQDMMIDLAKRSGAKGYVVKPYIADNLLGAVKRIIGNPR